MDQTKEIYTTNLNPFPHLIIRFMIYRLLLFTNDIEWDQHIQTNLQSPSHSVLRMDDALQNEQLAVSNDNISVPTDQVSVPGQQFSLPKGKIAVRNPQISVPSEHISLRNRNISLPKGNEQDFRTAICRCEEK